MRVFSSGNLDQACEFIQQGNLLAYPTEAVWGLGCDPFNEHAVTQILAIKQRPIEKGMIVIAPNIDSITEFFTPLPEHCQPPILTSWGNNSSQNQATTWLFPIPQHLPVNIPHWVTGGRATLAIRLIQQPNIAKLCQQLISPSNPYGFLISTSCNPTGQPPAIILPQAQAYFGDCPNVDYFEADTLGYTQPSQIRDAMTGKLVRE